jgi:hypothetical protein
LFDLQVAISEKQRDEALGTIKALNDKVEKLKIYSFKTDDLRGMPIQKLKTLQVSVDLPCLFSHLKSFSLPSNFSRNCAAIWKKSTRSSTRSPPPSA